MSEPLEIYRGYRLSVTRNPTGEFAGVTATPEDHYRTAPPLFQPASFGYPGLLAATSSTGKKDLESLETENCKIALHSMIDTVHSTPNPPEGGNAPAWNEIFAKARYHV